MDAVYHRYMCIGPAAAQVVSILDRLHALCGLAEFVCLGRKAVGQRIAIWQVNDDPILCTRNRGYKAIA